MLLPNKYSKNGVFLRKGVSNRDFGVPKDAFQHLWMKNFVVMKWNSNSFTSTILIYSVASALTDQRKASPFKMGNDFPGGNPGKARH